LQWTANKRKAAIRKNTGDRGQKRLTIWKDAKSLNMTVFLAVGGSLMGFFFKFTAERRSKTILKTDQIFNYNKL